MIKIINVSSIAILAIKKFCLEEYENDSLHIDDEYKEVYANLTPEIRQFVSGSKESLE